MKVSTNPSKLAREIAIEGEEIPAFTDWLSAAPPSEADIAWAKAEIKKRNEQAKQKNT